MNKEIVYISGPISEVADDEAEVAFFSAEKNLKKLGFDTLNPMHIASPSVLYSKPKKRRRVEKEGEWSYYMREALLMLMGADAIFMLRGWESSKGAKIEHDLGKTLGFEMLYEDEVVLSCMNGR